MVDSRGQRLDELAETVSGAAGVLPSSMRRALLAGARLPGELGTLAELVAAGGDAVTDEHVRRLLGSGYSEDMVFECVVAAAVGAGRCRLRAVERALENCRHGCLP